MRGNRKPIPVYYWPLWMVTLGVALIVFYGFLTPIWMLVRFVAWVSERRLLRPRTDTGAPR
jgi:hypothetical protein